MNEFDRNLKKMAREEPREVPESVRDRIQETLDDLPEQAPSGIRFRILPRIAAAAACFVFVLLFLLPNISPTYAAALEKVPGIGNFVHVVTIRNYIYDDSRHQMNIQVPEIQGADQAGTMINKDVSELTEILVSNFYKDLNLSGSSGVGSISLDYEAVTNTDRWFTLKLTVTQIAASSNSYYKFYHIDKVSGKIVTLPDLFAEEGYEELIRSEVVRQMNQQMEQDPSLVYWTENKKLGEDFVTIDAKRNFCWDENGNLVLLFDKYEVSPGFMGTPSFTIDRSVIHDLLKPEYQDITG